MTEDQQLEACRAQAQRCLRAIRATSTTEVLQVLGIAVTGVFDQIPDEQREEALERWMTTLVYVVRAGHEQRRVH